MKLKFKRALTIAAFFLLILIVLMVYTFNNFTDIYGRRKLSIAEDFQENKWLHFENRIRQLENGLNEHHEAVNQIRLAMKNIISSSVPSSVLKPFNQTSGRIYGVQTNLQPESEMIYESDCSFRTTVESNSDISMLDVYEQNGFENKDGGVWKQGWKIEIDEKDWNRNNILKVFVVPHSHNDPGWIKTIEEYYISQTKHILNNMLNKLPEDPQAKEQVKSLIKNGQLEIVSGGWVMNDEANSHWISIIQQYTDGHQWLQQNLNYTPKSSWSIDPFGLSVTQAALLKEMGFHHMLIQRVHYSIKKYFANLHQLEFRWRQMWAINVHKMY
ncbi:hypothetical protein WA026_023833 [Henosepilachna vigintioctopunctata]|uniref:Glycoside hydrolase family 38 N-terminal domain-containing protein n=1 Tax=Henosepilachna vigintioctopunctata TaxID=420089 RepID=A0AAW1VGY9_9CUCU